MSDKHGESIWNRGDARKIMREARKRFSSDTDPVSAHCGLASAHYSLVKRYVRPAPIWLWHLAIWHMWRAAVHAKRAHKLGLDKADQVDVVSRILLKVPRWLGGGPKLAAKIAQLALQYDAHNEQAEMLPHTRALLLMTLAECQERRGGSLRDGFSYCRQALDLEADIRKEKERRIALQQLCRVKKQAGAFYLRHPENIIDLGFGRHLLYEAELLAMDVSRDQLLEIHQMLND